MCIRDRYRTEQPQEWNLNSGNSLSRSMSTVKDVVFYSFMNPPSKPKIAAHEYKRLKLSWSSLRKHNTDIEVRFCYDGEDPMWKDLCDDYGVEMYPFHESFTGEEPMRGVFIDGII